MDSGGREVQIDDLFANAIELPLEQWQAFLDSAAVNHDPSVMAEVQKLLVAHLRAMQSTEFLATTPVSERPFPFDLGDQEAFIGKAIGPYKITRPLGRGGFGMVFLASRVQDFQQTVAIKFLATSVNWGKRDFARFERERQILADLQHENIARLLDGGTTPAGAPYIVMENINGHQITEFCDEKRMGVMDRLNLFSQICDAVGFAHERGVIHRDIKPANILVTDRGVVKLLDFGIAKMLDPVLEGAAVPEGLPDDPGRDVADAPLAGKFEPFAIGTGFGLGGPMTPAYASPEQIRGGEVTIVSDIYALGVVLYELLTGQRPYYLDYCSTHAEVVRIVCEREPILPSTIVLGHTAFQTLGGKPLYDPNERMAADRADKRRTTVWKLQRMVAGDLEQIVMMALRKNPSRRYQSVRALVDDLSSFKTGFPVAARPRNKLQRALYGLKRAFRYVPPS
jgi:serine/threonine protein kinase